MFPRPGSPRYAASAAKPAVWFWAGCGALAWLPCASACQDGPRSTDAPDAAPGPSCTAGTRGCICGPSDACDEGLLCISGRCFDTEGTRDQSEPERLPPARPLPPRGAAPPAGGSERDAALDAAAGSATDAGGEPPDAAP